MSRLTLYLDDSITPTCDHCGQPWPDTPTGQLPGAHRFTGVDEHGQPIIRLYCSPDCRQADQTASPS